MAYINICVVAMLLAVVYTDYREHLIYDRYIIAMICLGAARNYMQGGLSQLMINGCSLIILYLLCVLIGYLYQVKRHADIAGGGDYKLISVFAFLYGLQGLLLCLIFELIFEFVYRYILFPERKRDALPLGTTLGGFGILILLLGAQ